MRTVHSSLVLLIRDDQILLALKKRGFGMGRLNGAGGKLEPGETAEEAMIREAEEEIGVTPTLYHKVARHDFILGGAEPWRMITHTYLCTDWNGEPTESEEMKPQWFAQSDIPYTQMWDDDIVWLPLVLAGKLLETRFEFNADEQMRRAELSIVDSLEETS